MPIKSGLLILSLSSCCLWLTAVYAEAVIEQPSLQQTVTLVNFQNMTCPMCAITIKKALQQVNGVQQVTVDYTTKTATVIFDAAKTSSADLIKATTDIGYPASLSVPESQ